MPAAVRGPARWVRLVQNEWTWMVMVAVVRVRDLGCLRHLQWREQEQGDLPLRLQKSRLLIRCEPAGCGTPGHTATELSHTMQCGGAQLSAELS